VTKHRRAVRGEEAEELPFPAGSKENGPRPIVAVVGRPNVGKSTLFNRFVGQKIAIVHDEPGVTRDRHYADAWFGGRGYTLVDTGGFDPESDDPMKQGIARQVELAIAEADVVVCVFDALAGLTSADKRAVELLRRSKKPVIYVANKADSAAAEAEASDLYRLGISKLYGVSALHGRGFGELETAILAALPPEEPFEGPDVDDTLVRVAIIGRPNAGKSSLVNRITGQDRVLVDDRPGTTRDTIDTMVERDGQKFVLVDTAGIRRKSKVTKEHSLVEAVSVLHAIRAIERCDVVVLMCDASEGVSEQDAKILGLAVDRGRGVIIGLNKTDLCDKEHLKKAEEHAKDKLAFAPYAPFHRLSAATGRGVPALLELVKKVHASYVQRVATSQLNRFFEEVLETHPPPTQGGKAPRLYFMTQAQTRPPLFVVMTNAPESIHFSYHRYIANQLRKRFGLEGVPIKIRYKARRKAWRGDGGPKSEGEDMTG
jgi:GTP-binding protein